MLLYFLFFSFLWGFFFFGGGGGCCYGEANKWSSYCALFFSLELKVVICELFLICWTFCFCKEVKPTFQIVIIFPHLPMSEWHLLFTWYCLLGYNINFFALCCQIGSLFQYTTLGKIHLCLYYSNFIFSEQHAWYNRCFMWERSGSVSLFLSWKSATY